MDNVFRESAEAVGTTVKRFTTTGDALAYLAELAGGEPIALSPLPDDLRQSISGFPLASPGEYAGTRLAVSFAAAGVAATGSLLLDLSDPVGRSATALAPVHAVFLRGGSIVPDLASLKPIIGQALATDTGRYLSITTGPSRTADIERVLTIGVHGAKELHVLLLEGE